MARHSLNYRVANLQKVGNPNPNKAGRNYLAGTDIKVPCKILELDKFGMMWHGSFRGLAVKNELEEWFVKTRTRELEFGEWFVRIAMNKANLFQAVFL